MDGVWPGWDGLVLGVRVAVATGELGVEPPPGVGCGTRTGESSFYFFSRKLFILVSLSSMYLE